MSDCWDWDDRLALDPASCPAMEGGLINPLALIRTGAAKGVTSTERFRKTAELMLEAKEDVLARTTGLELIRGSS